MIIQDIDTYIADHFHYMIGPPRAFFEVYTDPKRVQIIRFIYQTLGFGMRIAKTAEALREAQDRLLGRMHKEFVLAFESFQFPDPVLNVVDEFYKPMLFWRRRLAFSCDPLPETDLLMARLTCRVVIPGYEFPIGTGPVDGDYRYPEP